MDDANVLITKEIRVLYRDRAGKAMGARQHVVWDLDRWLAARSAECTANRKKPEAAGEMHSFEVVG